MRASSNAQCAGLIVRNQKLVLELSRLQDINRMLKRNVQLLKKDNLLVKRPSREASTQTDFDADDERGQSNSRRRSSSLGPFSPLPSEIVETLEISVKRSGSTRSRRDSVMYEAVSLAPVIGSPCQERMTVRLSDRVGTPIFTTLSPTRRRKTANDIVGVQDEETEEYTPSGNLDCAFGSADDDPSMPRANLAGDPRFSPESMDSPELSPLSPDPIESAPVDSILGNLGRTPRSTKKPVSYKEPSLSAKVRKGYTFFKFN